VGPNESVFKAHEEFLRSKSEYFRTALEGNWREAIEGTFKFPDDNAAVFSLFIDWLYHSRIKFKLIRSMSTDVYLAEAYFLGDKRGCRQFMNDILDALSLLWNSGCLPSVDVIKLAFSQNIPAPHLRNLIIAKHAWEGADHETLVQQRFVGSNDVPAKFAQGVYTTLLRRIRMRSLLSQDGAAAGGRMQIITASLVWTIPCVMTMKMKMTMIFKKITNYKSSASQVVTLSIDSNPRTTTSRCLLLIKHHTIPSSVRYTTSILRLQSESALVLGCRSTDTRSQF